MELDARAGRRLRAALAAGLALDKALRRGAVMPGRQFWLSLAIVAGLLAGASSPEIAQRVPRFLFPALGAAGGLLVLLLLVRVIRRSRAEGRVRPVRLAVNTLAALVLVVFPLAHAARALTGLPPRILTGFGDWLGAEGYPRLSPHRGLDVQGRPGSDVLAAAPGRVGRGLVLAGQGWDLQLTAYAAREWPAKRPLVA